MIHGLAKQNKYVRKNKIIVSEIDFFVPLQNDLQIVHHLAFNVYQIIKYEIDSYLQMDEGRSLFPST